MQRPPNYLRSQKPKDSIVMPDMRFMWYGMIDGSVQSFSVCERKTGRRTALVLYLN